MTETKTPPIAKMFLDAYGKMWECFVFSGRENDSEGMKLQKWARTRTTTNCGLPEYAVAQFILNQRKTIRD